MNFKIILPCLHNWFLVAIWIRKVLVNETSLLRNLQISYLFLLRCYDTLIRWWLCYSTSMSAWKWFPDITVALCFSKSHPMWQVFPHKYLAILTCFFTLPCLQYFCREGNYHTSILTMPKSNEQKIQLAKQQQNFRQIKALWPSQGTAFLQTNKKMTCSERLDGKYTWF